MNLHLQITTVPHPDDIRAGNAGPVSSTWLTSPDKLLEAIKGFVERANSVDLWKDRGSLVIVVQPVLEPGKPS